ncbi:MAG: carboxypeptidase regulatory-like domain-containing protein [Armatimonadetes bacterium]|nr:carboxypeptidase regulatory-like domain-containing protein [Armatimonadota bacterium]
MTTKICILTLSLTLVAHCSAQTATIVGKVKLNGTPPKPKALNMKDDPGCVAAHGNKTVYSEEVVVGKDGGLRWCFVSIRSGVKGAYKPPAKPVVLDQIGCVYKPHVFGVQTGQTIEIRNSDPVLHNVHAVTKINPPFNIGQPRKGMKNVKVFMKPEQMIRIKCDVHQWMVTYCGVVEHPFFDVSKADGTFEIKNLPPGTYTLGVWHEKFGSKTEQITVKAGERKTVNFEYDQK